MKCYSYATLFDERERGEYNADKDEVCLVDRVNYIDQNKRIMSLVQAGERLSLYREEQCSLSSRDNDEIADNDNLELSTMDKMEIADESRALAERLGSARSAHEAQASALKKAESDVPTVSDGAEARAQSDSAAKVEM